MPAAVEPVPAFRIQRHDVTNADYLEFVQAGGYSDARWWRSEDWAWIRTGDVRHPLFWEPDGDGWQWRGMFDRMTLPGAWPVWVSQAEASAYARWRGLRLPTEAQYQRAAFGSPDERPRRHPWGDAAPDPARGVFDFNSWDPEPAGSHPAGQSAWGVHDLVGNGWEWTSTPFAPFPGFAVRPSYPEYSAEFFDGEHFVMKGASPATARELLRPSFRNWFRARYPYMYASFRCVAGVADDAGAAGFRPSPRGRGVHGAVRRRRGLLSVRDAAAAAVALSLRRPRLGALRGHRTAAVVPGDAGRDGVCSTRTRAPSWPPARPSPTSSSWARAAARSWRGCCGPARRGARRCASTSSTCRVSRCRGRPGSSSGCPRCRWSRIRPPTRRAWPRSAASSRARGAPWPCSSDRTSGTSTPRRRTSCCSRSTPPCVRATCSCSAPTS